MARKKTTRNLDRRIYMNRVEADRLDDLMRRFRPAQAKVEELRHAASDTRKRKVS